MGAPGTVLRRLGAGLAAHVLAPQQQMTSTGKQIQKEDTQILLKNVPLSQQALCPALIRLSVCLCFCLHHHRWLPGLLSSPGRNSGCLTHTISVSYRGFYINKHDIKLCVGSYKRRRSLGVKDFPAAKI